MEHIRIISEPGSLFYLYISFFSPFDNGYLLTHCFPVCFLFQIEEKYQKCTDRQIKFHTLI